MYTEAQKEKKKRVVEILPKLTNDNSSQIQEILKTQTWETQRKPHLSTS